MAIKEQESVTSSPFQREETAEQDGAVPSEHDGKFTGIERGPHCVGEAGRIVGDCGWIEQKSVGVPFRIVWRRLDMSGHPGPEPNAETGCKEHLREPADATRKQPEHRRRPDYRYRALHAPILTASTSALKAAEEGRREDRHANTQMGYGAHMTTTPQESNEPASEPTAPADSTIDDAGLDQTEELGKAASDAPVDDDSPSDTAN